MTPAEAQTHYQQAALAYSNAMKGSDPRTVHATRLVFLAAFEAARVLRVA